MSISNSVRAGGVQSSQVRPRARSAIRNTFAFCLLGLVLLAAAGAVAAEGAAAPIDVNRATAAQLEALPGIGAVKAAAILAVRDEKGGFRSVGELESVRGIGPALVEKLRPLVVVGELSGPSPERESGSRPAAKPVDRAARK